jgi:serine/threonine protein kinase
VPDAGHICQKCGQPTGVVGSGNLASWLFRPGDCQCEQQSDPMVQKIVEPSVSESAGKISPERALKRCQSCNSEYPLTFLGDLCTSDGGKLVTAYADQLVGATIEGRYRVRSLLGTGSWGTVYLAEDPDLKREVAVKVMHAFLSRDEMHCKRFQNEVRTASSLDHPQIARVFDCGKMPDGRPYMVMEYLRGIGLDQLLQTTGELSVKRTIGIVSLLCGALDFAHQKGIVHRDLKPGNIILLENDTPKLLDFGLAKRNDTSTSLTAQGQIIGTAAYMSPEQFRGEETDLRVDIYSLGAVMHYMLTARPVFEAETLFKYMDLHLHQEPPTMAVVRPDLYIPLALQDIVLRCLSKDKAARFASCLEMRDTIADYERRYGSAAGKASYKSTGATSNAETTAGKSKSLLPFMTIGGVIIAASLALLFTASQNGRSTKFPQTDPKMVANSLETSATTSGEGGYESPNSTTNAGNQQSESPPIEFTYTASQKNAKGAANRYIGAARIARTNHDTASEADLLGAAEKALDQTSFPSIDPLYALIYYMQARECLHAHNLDRAESRVKKSMAIYDQHRNYYTNEIAADLELLFSTYSLRGDYQTAAKIAAEEASLVAPGSSSMGNALRLKGDAAFALNDYNSAFAKWKEAREIYHSRGNLWIWQVTTLKLANQMRIKRRYREAATFYQEAADSFESKGQDEKMVRARADAADCLQQAKVP